MRPAPALAACLLAGIACDRPSRAPDAEAPRVLDRTPAPGENDVAVRAPIRATFSEPIDPATVTDTTVLFTGPGGVALSKLLHLSADGRELTLEPVVAPVAPTALTVTLTAGIRDVAGNALVPPGTWSFSYPVWLGLGQGLTADAAYRADTPRAAVASDGRVWVVWRQAGQQAGPAGPVFTQAVRVASWDGSAWALAGGALNSDPSVYTSRGSICMAPDATAPVVVFDAQIGTAGNTFGLRARRWDGTAWQPLGDIVNDDPSRDVYYRKVASRPGGTLVAAWEEQIPSSGTLVRVKEWDGTAWQPVSGGAASTEAEAAAGGTVLDGLGLDGQGRAVVALGIGGAQAVRRAEGGAWVGLGNPVAFDGPEFSLGVGTAMAWVTAQTSVACGGGTCGQTIVYAWNGTDWTSLGNVDPSGVRSVGQSALAVATGDTPVLAYNATEQDLTTGGAVPVLRVARYQGSAWVDVGGRLLEGGSLGDASIALDGSGVAFVFVDHSPDGVVPAVIRGFRENR